MALNQEQQLLSKYNYDGLSNDEIMELIELEVKSQRPFNVDISKLQKEKPSQLHEESTVEPGSGEFYMYIGVALICILTAGLASGLTIGLASIDRLSLEIDAKDDKEIERMTQRIFPVIDKHHWMLVTLLLMNALAMETLPIAFKSLTSPLTAEILSVICVLFFGEIIP